MLTVTGRPPGDPPDTRPAQEPTGRFGELLRTLRRHAGLTQRDLADRTGLSTGAIRDLEQGRTRSPKSDSIDAIAKISPMPGGTYVATLTNGQELQVSRIQSRMLRETLLKL